VILELGQQKKQINLSRLAGFGAVRKFRAGCVVTFQGDDATGVYMVKSGYVKVFSSDEMGNEIVYRVQQPGSLFGELALLDDLPRSASVAAMQDCELIYVPGSKFRQMIVEEPDLAMAVFSILTCRIRELSETLADYISGSVYQRLKKLLEEMASSQNGKLPVAMRHRDLAGLLGSSREMITKLLNGLKNGGYIQVENKVIYLLSPLPEQFP
jgi:CRP/FNR family cyclic AMP-dependent transcriptional regulator